MASRITVCHLSRYESGVGPFHNRLGCLTLFVRLCGIGPICWREYGDVTTETFGEAFAAGGTPPVGLIAIAATKQSADSE